MRGWGSFWGEKSGKGSKKGCFLIGFVGKSPKRNWRGLGLLSWSGWEGTEMERKEKSGWVRGRV